MDTYNYPYQATESVSSTSADFSFWWMIFFMAVVGAIILLFTLIWRWRQKKIRVRKATDLSFLQVLVPQQAQKAEHEPFKDFKELMSAADQMFSSFSSLKKGKGWLRPKNCLSFEIVAKDNHLAFYVVAPKPLSSLVEKQIHSFYPDAQIEQNDGFKIFQPGQPVSVAQLRLVKPFVFPIRTYKYLERDPLNNLTNILSKLGEGNRSAIQILIQPAGRMWRLKANSAASRIRRGKSVNVANNLLEKILVWISEGIDNFITKKDDKSQPEPHQPTPLQEEMMNNIKEKADKSAFGTEIRLLTTGQDEAANENNLSQMIAAFGQFSAPDLNSFRPSKIWSKPLFLTDFILRHLPTRAKNLLNTEELASIYHFPTVNVTTPNIKWLKSRFLPAPVDLPQEGTTLGESVYRNQRQLVKITADDRRRHLFMIGKTGVGKTTIFENMAEQDIRAGHGVCFIDPLGDAIESLLKKIPAERMNDVILFDPGDSDFPFGLNLLEWQKPEQRDFLIQELVEIFYKLFDPGRTGIVGPQWEHWMRNAALSLMIEPSSGTLIDIPRLFTDDGFRTEVIKKVTDPVVQSFWEKQLAKTADFHKSEMYNYFISKFGRFMSNELMRNIIGQNQSSFDFRQVMDEGKILLINLAKGKIGETNSALLGMIIVSKIQVAAFSRADTPEDKRKDFYLYVDEFQNFTTNTFATILSEARKYRLNLNITNQYIAQLTEPIRDAVIGNAGTMIVYRIGAADAEFMVKEFEGVSIEDMTNLDRFTAYVKLLINLTPSKPFSMKGLKSETSPDQELGEKIRQSSRQKYGRRREEVEKNFAERMKIGANNEDEPLSREKGERIA